MIRRKQKEAEDAAILFISHDASRTGAPISLLNTMRWIRTAIPNQLKLVLRQGGPLESQFAEVAEVYQPGDDRCLDGVGLIYSNTITNGNFLREFPYGNIPIVTHVHEMDYVISCYGQENLAEVKRQSTHYIVCSEATSKSLAQIYNINHSELTIVPEAISPSEISIKAESPRGIRDLLEANQDDVLVVCCGTLDLRKGVDLVIQLAGYCQKRQKGRDSAKFVWIGGNGENPVWELLQRDLKKLGFQNLKFVGELENPYPYLAAADILCLASREDPFPLVMLEAGALGKPTLAFMGSGGAEEYCQRGGGFAVPYLDIFKMGDWILEMIGHRSVLTKIGRQAQQLVLSRYSVDITGPKILSVIKRYLRSDVSASAGFSQVFIPKQSGYSQESSIRKQVMPSQWNSVSFEFQAKEFNEGLSMRFDPLDRLAVIEIKRLVLKSANSGGILWNAETNADFDMIRVEGTAIRIPDPGFLKLFSFGLDPILILPVVPTDELNLELEIEMRVDRSDYGIAQQFEKLIACRQGHESPAGLDNARKINLAILCSHAYGDGRPIYIWGAGSAGRNLAQMMHQHGFALKAFIDPDPKKAGDQIAGCSVHEPSVLLDRTKENPFIIIGSKFYQEISQRLLKMGFIMGVDFVPSPFVAEDMRWFVNANLQ